jgi:hypothetical protein
MAVKQQSEKDILLEMIAELEQQLEDPFCEDRDQAEQIIERAKERLEAMKSGFLSASEDKLKDDNGKDYVVNASGHGEPDIVSTNPGDRVLAPNEVEQLQISNGAHALKEKVRRCTETPATREDFKDVVMMAASLDITANQVASMWSELELHGFGAEYTKGGIFALKQMVLVRYLRDTIGSMYNIFNTMSAKIAVLEKPPGEAKRGRR